MSTINEVPATPSPSPLAATNVGALAKPSITFVVRSSDDNLATISGRILAGMTANAAYPAPVPTLVVLAAARAAFVAAVNANDRGKVGIAARDKARRQLGQVLRDLALFVQQHSGGDLVTLLSSGYPAQRRRGAAVKAAPAAPVGIRLQPGPLSGQVSGLCDRVVGAVLYQWRYATAQAPTAYTQTDTDSKARVTFGNLVPGTQYLVQVRACGKRGSSDWSDPVAVYAV
jgi:hypothetical protein